MTIYDQNIELFKKSFQKHSHKKIVIYGTGGCTMTLLEKVEGYNFIGLLDGNDSLIGQKKYGLTVIDREAAEKQADFLVICTGESYWKIIYDRIKDWNIPIYTLDGKLASELFLDNRHENVYWKKCKEDLENTIEKYDVILFDIFDVLVMRKIYDYQDVFLLVDMRLKSVYGEKASYIEYRNKAIQQLNNPTIDGVYKTMQELSGWDDKMITHAKDIEISIDKRLMSPREDMVDVFKKICKQKKCFLIHDAYYSEEFLQELLEDIGCDVTREQLIFSYDGKEGKAVHISSVDLLDVSNVQNQDEDVYYIMSASKMLQNSTFFKCVPEIKTLQDSLGIGILMNKMFNSPFALHKTNGKVDFTDDRMAGYGLYGGIVYAYIIWLIETAKKDEIDQLLFVARDGFLLVRAYEYVCDMLGLKDAPKSLYFETSKRALLPFQMYTEEDIAKNLKCRNFIGTMDQLLDNRFNISCEKKKTKEITWYDESLIEMLIEKYGDIILSQARKNRIAYEKYVKKCQISSRVAMVDVGFAGEIQSLLNMLLNGNLKGYYMSADLRKENPYYKDNMKGCFQAEDDKGACCAEVRKKFLYIESFFTAPNGSLRYVDECGKMIYGEKMQNQKKFHIRYKMFDGILEYISDMICICKELQIEYRITNYIFIDKLFGIMIDGGFEVSQEMKDSFYYDDILSMSLERSLW